MGHGHSINSQTPNLLIASSENKDNIYFCYHNAVLIVADGPIELQAESKSCQSLKMYRVPEDLQTSRRVEFYSGWLFWNMQIFFFFWIWQLFTFDLSFLHSHKAQEKWLQFGSAFWHLISFSLLSLICKMKRMIFTYGSIMNVKWGDLCKICATVRMQQKKKKNKLLPLNLNGKRRRVHLTFSKCKWRFTQPFRATFLSI